jgi:hypothetical protein
MSRLKEAANLDRHRYPGPSDAILPHLNWATLALPNLARMSAAEGKAVSRVCTTRQLRENLEECGHVSVSVL